jgi:hypothetical protein
MSDNMTDREDQGGYVEEYKELRAEIRHYLDRRAKSTHFALIVTAAVVGVAPELGSPFLFLVPRCSLPSFGTMKHAASWLYSEWPPTWSYSWSLM